LITVAVGTFIRGFDDLVRAADGLGREGFAQIGHSAFRPQHLEWACFLPQTELFDRLRRSELLIGHAGMGLIGDGLRAGCRLIVVPRRGAIGPGNPINDQRAFARRLASMLPITVCEDLQQLPDTVRRVLDGPRPGPTRRRSNVPELIAGFLARG